MKHRRLATLTLAVLIMGITFAGCARKVGDESEVPPDIEVLSGSELPDEPVDEPAPAEDFAPAPDRPAVAPFKSDVVTRYPAKAAALLQPEYGKEDAAAHTVASGANRFALRLSAELVSKKPGENFVCSPYSVWLPLAALLDATDEAHREKLLAALGAGGCYRGRCEPGSLAYAVRFDQGAQPGVWPAQPAAYRECCVCG